MKIVFLSRYQKINERGAENFVSELSKRLSKHHQVIVLDGKDSDSLSNIINGEYDIVIPINGRLQSLKASLGRLFGKYKLLISGHSGIGRDDIWNILLRPDVFVVLTEYQRKWAKKWTLGTKIVKIPNGVDINKFSSNRVRINLKLEKPIILSVGALTWYKHHDRVINAMAKISKGSLLIAGKGPDKNRLEELGQKFLGKRIKIANFNYEDMPKIYHSCDLFTLPSWDREAFGIVYLEAMAAGLGVVAPDDSPRREIVGDAGLFVDVTDSAKYAQAIEQALKIDWSKKSRMQAEKYSWDKVAKLYEKVLKDLLP